MDRNRRTAKTEEGPLGIVISNGPRADDAPRFTAYVWGPVPETDEADQRPEQELVAVA